MHNCAILCAARAGRIKCWSSRQRPTTASAAQARSSRRGAGLLRIADARTRSLPARGRRLGPRKCTGREQRIPRRRGPVGRQRALSRSLGPAPARALQQHRRGGSLQGSAATGSEERPSLSRPGARQRRRLRQQGDRLGREGARARSEAGRSARAAGRLALEDSDTAQAVAQADEAIKLAPDALDAMAIHAAVELLADRSPDAWLAKIAQVNPTYGEAYALVAHHLVLQYRYEDARRLLPQGDRARSAALVRALGARHQPDAPGPGGRAAPAARDVLRQRLSRRRHRQQPAPARQLQELRHLQGRHDHPQAEQERSRPAASVLRRSAEARHRHLRKEIQDEAARPRAGRGLSRPRRLRGAHHGHAGPRRAGRHLRRSRRHGQPLGPQARRLSTGRARCGTR